MIVRNVRDNSIIIVRLPVMVVDGEAVEVGAIVLALEQVMAKMDCLAITMPATNRRVIDTGDKNS
ncbi:MAG: hypothetical protein JSV54_07015 [Chloroflexota bacterium]|nr:MAG: hypothetical protein JSV54_07015 [Chloroflexota bacterium]